MTSRALGGRQQGGSNRQRPKRAIREERSVHHALAFSKGLRQLDHDFRSRCLDEVEIDDVLLRERPDESQDLVLLLLLDAQVEEHRGDIRPIAIQRGVDAKCVSAHQPGDWVEKDSPVEFITREEDGSCGLRTMRRKLFGELACLGQLAKWHGLRKSQLLVEHVPVHGLIALWRKGKREDLELEVTLP